MEEREVEREEEGGERGKGEEGGREGRGGKGGGGGRERGNEREEMRRQWGEDLVLCAMGSGTGQTGHMHHM